jgi:hypothetical protein
MTWLPRTAVHLVAAVGATSVFVVAAVAGAHETVPPGAPQAVVAQATPRPTRTPRERSVAGTIREARPDGRVVVDTLRGQELQVQPAPGALIRLNGKASPLDGLQAGDRVIILGQAQPRGRVFLAHAITARRPR